MQLRIGIVGIGGLGYLQAKTFADMEGVSITGAADVSEDARQLFESEFDVPAYEHYRTLIQEHIDELDAVTIVTPHTLHYEQVRTSLERGLHVLVEKPMVTEVGHAVDLVDTAVDRDLVLQVGYQRHFHPGFREIRRIIRNGRIGDIHAVNCYLGQDWIRPHRDTWRTDPALSGGGQLYDTGSHLLDVLLWTTAAQPATVASHVDYFAPQVDVNSAFSLRMDRDGDSLIGGATISGDGVDVDPREGYLYWGTQGRMAYTGNRITVAEKGAMTYSTEISSGTDFQTLNRRKLSNFTRSIRGTEEPAVPGDVGLNVTALTEAIYRSADTGSVVDIEPLLEEAAIDR